MKRRTSRLRAFSFWLIVVSMSFLLTIGLAQESERRDTLVLENEKVILTLSAQTGQILQLEDKQAQRLYLIEGSEVPAFRVAANGDMQTVEAEFSVVQATEEQCHLQWKMPKSTLRAQISLLDDGVCFRAELENGEKTGIRAFEYPILGALTDYGMDGYLAHSYATGVLFQNPQSYMNSYDGLRYAPYPEGFSGATMQFFTYYEKDHDGLYFAALDADAHQKWLNVYAERGGLIASHMTGYEDIRVGNKIEMTYDFQVRFLGKGNWQAAAEQYKQWALEQPWARRGVASGREDHEKATWLLEEVGLSTFGINAGADRTKWLNRYREDIATKTFHILGPDWTNIPQTFGMGIPGDLEDWLPTKFNQDNLENIRENGDYYAPFEFDFLISLSASNPKTLAPHVQRFPTTTFSHDAYAFNMLCPGEAFTKTFHRTKNVEMLKEANLDAVYYDISANNLIKICTSTKHGHTPGGGYELTLAYQDVYQDTKQALDKEAGRYIPMGTEMINETLLGELDYYQARAWAQPSSTLETWPFRAQMRNQKAEMIPMFDYVYHELGTVRLDGWGKLVEEIGDYYYHTVSRVYLWGGLYELNYEYSPLEELDGEENSPQEHYFHFDPQHYAYSQNRAAYLRQFAAARTGLANPYWAYGTMTALPQVETETVQSNWYHYNHNQGDSSYQASGTVDMPAVHSSAFLSPEGNYGLFLSNADGKEQQVRLTFSPQSLRLEEKERQMVLITAFDQETPEIVELGTLGAEEHREMELTLEPYTLYMLELR